MCELGKVLVIMPDVSVTVLAHNQVNAAAYADLWLMTQCQCVIIANSTFIWRAL